MPGGIGLLLLLELLLLLWWWWTSTGDGEMPVLLDPSGLYVRLQFSTAPTPPLPCCSAWRFMALVTPVVLLLMDDDIPVVLPLPGLQSGGKRLPPPPPPLPAAAPPMALLLLLLVVLVLPPPSRIGARSGAIIGPNRLARDFLKRVMDLLRPSGPDPAEYVSSPMRNCTRGTCGAVLCWW